MTDSRVTCSNLEVIEHSFHVLRLIQGVDDRSFHSLKLQIESFLKAMDTFFCPKYTSDFLPFQ